MNYIFVSRKLKEMPKRNNNNFSYKQLLQKNNLLFFKRI